MSDAVIRYLPDAVSAEAAEVGLSRVESIGLRPAQHVLVITDSWVTRHDLHRFGRAVAGLADEELMGGHGMRWLRFALAHAVTQ